MIETSPLEALNETESVKPQKMSTEARAGHDAGHQKMANTARITVISKFSTRDTVKPKKSREMARSAARSRSDNLLPRVIKCDYDRFFLPQYYQFAMNIIR